MFGKSSVDVLVIGAGPVGMFAALQLARRGEKVRILDRGQHPSQESYALALHINTLHMLDGLGLASGLIEKGQRIRQMVFEKEGEEVLSVDFSVLSDFFPYLLSVPQSELEATLLKGLETAGVKIEWNSELTGLEESGSGITATVNHMEEMAQGYAVSGMQRSVKGKSTIEARYLVGADGFRSTVRRLLNIPLTNVAPMKSYDLFEIEEPAPDPGQMRIVLDGARTNVLWPLPKNRSRWTFELPAAKPGEPEPSDFITHMKRIGRTVNPATVKMRWSTRVSFEQCLATRFGSDRCWLAGDAAHQALPFGVQSLNSGLLEAALIASRIGDARGTGVQSVSMDDYLTGRHAEWRWILGLDSAPSDLPPPGSEYPLDPKRLRTLLPATGRNLHHLFRECLRKGFPQGYEGHLPAFAEEGYPV